LNSLHHILPVADKSLDRPGGKKRKHVTNPRDFNNIETEAFIIFFARQCAEEYSHQSESYIRLFTSWSG